MPTRDRLLESAISLEQIEVQYQPIIEPRSGRIVGAEALARSRICNSATALFERAAAGRLDQRLSRLVQRKALRSAAVWEGPLKDLKLSINLLPADLANPGFERWLLDEIDASGIAPARVTAEITESALLEDREAVADRLASLRAAGVTVAVDDFGTGYASLAYLTALPLDMLKIDRGLVTDIADRERDRIVVQAIIRLAHELGLKVLVEGVESTAQLVLLCEWGCDLYQGFIGAGALTELELARFVAATTAEAA
ncbi:EAL domain-containing protein [Sphingomonas lutea]|uniref:EAL domain-containing protein n=1 Tax=Sphingomonas lutea TaxID=1045317 RepID=A0A7G9SFC1_9SPHN|nr:EAL domain-containing protein [Sphingomonas lutea]QNN66546.1 EAL domain-containing protein [Sphingomonas lutea]